ncbi:MAG TPA: ATP-binding protein [Planctomycetota bacterium]|nr:ATP-binding protein [Planctomycetota bacterium]
MVQDLEGVAAPKNADELLGAFNAFMEKAAELEQSHALLQAKVAELTDQLAVKVREVEGLKNHLASVLENVADAVVAVDTAGRVTHFNRAAAELFGRSEAQMRGRPAGEAGELAAPLAAMLKAVLEGGTSRSSEERSVLRADGSEAVLLLSAAPLRDERRRPVGAVASAQDVTVLRELERALGRKERLAALGEMAAVLAHEIRNPLGGIQLYAGLLGRSTTLSASEREVVEKISRGITGLNKLVEDMLAFAREIVARRVRQDVRLPVEAALELAGAELDAKHVIVEKAGWDRPLEVAVDGDLLTRALVNLFTNAAEAVEVGGRVEVSARFEEAAGVRLLELRVADNGRGINPADVEKIFNPFYTTKARGTGLGLAVVSRIVAAHGGDVRAENLPGGGSCFVLRLPAEAEG